ncbi:MAG: EAL domain-containing protein [Rhodanobacter sp.]
MDKPKPCDHCLDDEPLGFEFTVAFQPIVNITTRTVFAYESLVRGLDGSSAATILARVNKRNLYTFDQKCRVTAVEMASKLDVSCFLSINFLPNAVYQPSACIRATLAAAKRCNFPTDRLIFEITENERPNQAHLKNIVVEYRRQGFKTAFDDFGAGYSGLSLLAEFQPDIIKLDMALVRGIDEDKVRQAIVRGLLDICRALRVQVIAEGVEQIGELRMLKDLGVHLFQGFLFARPGFESLPDVYWPEVE